MRRVYVSALLTVALVAAACGGGASPTPAPTSTPTPTPAPTAVPTPDPTPVATASAPPSAGTPVDAAAGLQIAPPYEIVAVDAAIDALFAEQWTQATGAFGDLVGFGTRQVTEDGALRAFVVVLDFPGELTSAPAFWSSLLAGVSAQSGAEPEIVPVAGVDVHKVTSGDATFGLYQSANVVIVVIPAAADQLVPICEALITANG